MDVPSSVRFLVVGAGVHGLSTAWHLAMELESRGTGKGSEILLIDKSGPGAGATGIACGCVRNLYMTKELHPILRHSVDVWSYDPINFGFQQVGYISCGEANQIADYETMVASHRACDYDTDLYVGAEARSFLKRIWPDFKTDGIEVCHHEKPSGYAGTAQAVLGLTQKCLEYGVQMRWGVEVQAYELTGDRVSGVYTNRGNISAECVILCAGAWVSNHWEWLQLPEKLDIRYPDGMVAPDVDMWTFWRLLEGEVFVDKPYRTSENRDPPVLHVELMNTPVIDPKSGQELQDHTYVYWKYAAERMGTPGVQGGIIPKKIGPKAELEPYGHANDSYQAEPEFADILCTSMGQLMSRFEGCREQFKERRNGGIGAFTPDNVPIFDWIKDNVYMVADSNHGFKMTGVGKLLAHHLATGDTVSELAPFSMSRFANGSTFGDRNSNCPWV